MHASVGDTTTVSRSVYAVRLPEIALGLVVASLLPLVLRLTALFGILFVVGLPGRGRIVAGAIADLVITPHDATRDASVLAREDGIAAVIKGGAVVHAVGTLTLAQAVRLG